MNADILLIATHRYKQFIPQMLDSIDKHIKFPARTVLFTDEARGLADMEFEIEHEPFPYCSLFRYHYFNQVAQDLTGDHLIYVDIDARFNADTGEEILGDLIAVRHCGYYFKNDLPQETNKESVFSKSRFSKYFGGGMQGGKRENYLAASKWMEEKINLDLDKGILPRCHDETAWNAYLSVNPPTKELTPSYHFPEEVVNRKPEWEHDRNHFVNNCWNGSIPFEPKMILLKKEHEKIRV